MKFYSEAPEKLNLTLLAGQAASLYVEHKKMVCRRSSSNAHFPKIHHAFNTQRSNLAKRVRLATFESAPTLAEKLALLQVKPGTHAAVYCQAVLQVPLHGLYTLALSLSMAASLFLTAGSSLLAFVTLFSLFCEHTARFSTSASILA